MTKKRSRVTDPDILSAGAALLRASRRARELAARTGTEFVVIRDGKLVREIPSLTEFQIADDSSKKQDGAK